MIYCVFLGFFRLFFGGEYFHLLQESLSDTFRRDSRDLIGCDVNDTSFVRIHKIQDFIFPGLLDLVSDLLGSLLYFSLFSFPEKIAVGLHFFCRHFVEEVLQSKEQGSILPEKQVLIHPIEDEIKHVILFLDLIPDFQGV